MNESHQSTERMAESTVDQGQQTMEQLIDLQRNMARATLSALEWQETAQRQGLEMTRSMLENAPGQRFTESMMRNYLQGMEAMMPEMERMMERGMEAATQPPMEEGGARGHSSGRRGQQRGDQQGRGQPSHGQGPSGQQRRGRAAPTGQQTGGRNAGGRSTTTQPPRTETGGQQGPGGGSQRYSRTGEWVSPGEYGGEPAGSGREAMAAESGRSRGTETRAVERQGGGPPRAEPESRPAPRSDQFQQGQHRQRGTQPEPRQGDERSGGQPQPQGGDRTRGGPEQDRPTGQGRSPPRQAGRAQSSQRIDTRGRERGDARRPTAQETGGGSATRGPGPGAAETRERGEATRSEDRGEGEPGTEEPRSGQE
jgi:hypothetical protein